MSEESSDKPLNIKICVNTVKGFSEKTLPFVIPSLLSAGIEKEDIYIFEGGHDERVIDTYEGITYIKTNHNSLEYTSFVEIVENKIEADYWFYTHDTVVVGENFKSLLYNIPEDMPDKIALRHFPSMSIGTYKYEYLLTNKDLITGIKNTDYDRISLVALKKWGVGNEDYILWKHEPHLTRTYNPHIYGPDEYPQVLHQSNIYGTETIRRAEYFPQLDLVKHKSNWGQSQDVGISI